jgi:hypothetical protein
MRPGAHLEKPGEDDFLGMIEIGIGVLFAVMFIAAYLIVKKLLGGGDDSLSRWRELGGRTAAGGAKAVASKSPKLFLTANEMREHHSKPKGNQPDKK